MTMHQFIKKYGYQRPTIIIAQARENTLDKALQELFNQLMEDLASALYDYNAKFIFNRTGEGLDNPADLPDDSNGNPAKESGK